MDVVALINGFMIYLLLMLITIGIAFLGGFIGIKIKKRNQAKKEAEKTSKKDNFKVNYVGKK